MLRHRDFVKIPMPFLCNYAELTELFEQVKMMSLGKVTKLNIYELKK